MGHNGGNMLINDAI